MPIEREVIQAIADVDWTDDARVKVWMRKRQMKLTIPEARALRSELDAAIGEASRAADGLVHIPVPLQSDVDHIGPDCAAGKHPCDGGAWDFAAEVEVPCECPCHREAAAA